MLIGRYITNIRIATICVFLVLMAISGCEPKNEPPKAILEVILVSTKGPVEIRMKVTGEDPNGIEDLKEYIYTIQHILKHWPVALDHLNDKKNFVP